MTDENHYPFFHNVDSTIGAQAKEFNEEVTINLGGAPHRTEPEHAEQPQYHTDGHTP